MNHHLIFLTCIEPPGNLQKEMISLRRVLFREAGVVSALVLPPIVPVFFSAGEPDERSLDTLISACEGIFCTEEIVIYKNSIFISLKNKELWQKMRETFASNEEKTLFEPFPGIFLASEIGDIDLSEQELKKLLSVPPQHGEYKWKSSNLTVLKIYYETQEKWWENLFWETVFSRKIKKPQ